MTDERPGDAAIPANRRWDETTAAQRIIARLDKAEGRVAKTEKQTIGQWGAIVAAVVAIGAVLTVMAQAGIFSMQHGWAWASKEEVKAREEKVDARFDSLERKVDDLPHKLAEEMKRNGRR